MSHHKRKRPKHRRRGCLLCKPHKDEREPKTAKPSVRRKLQAEEDFPADKQTERGRRPWPQFKTHEDARNW